LLETVEMVDRVVMEQLQDAMLAMADMAVMVVAYMSTK